MTSIILTVLVKASLIMIAAAAIALASRRASAAKRHMIWAISIVAIIVLPVFAVLLPTLRVVVPAPSAAGRFVSAIDSEPALAPASETPALTSSRRDSATPMPLSPANETQPVSQPLRWGTIALAIYLAGVAVLAIKLAAERLAVGRLVRASCEVTDDEWLDLAAVCIREAGVQSHVRLLRSLDRTMPMAFGVLKPTVLIPSIADTWSHDRRRAVLLHELSHIARRDCLTQLVTRIACALYWPHPGTWLIARRLRVERELACDDRVLSIGTAAPEYAQHLLELAYSLGGYRAPALVVSMARPKQLEGRMLAVLDHARNRTTPAARSRMTAAAIAALIVLPLAATELSAIPAATFIAEKGASLSSDLIAPSSPAIEEQSARRQERPRREIQLPGTWQLRQSRDSKRWHLQLSERPNSTSGFQVSIDELQGLSAGALNGAGGPVKFTLRREAGTLTFEGTVRSGVAAGTFDFTPSATFAAEMTKRGYERPTNDEMYVLARNDIGTSYLDELSKQKYARPSLDELLRAGDHGVDLDYLHEMGGAGYHLGQIEHLIRTRDHGVDVEFVDGLKSHGLTGLSVDELVRARDHGVDPEYIGGMKMAGHNMRDLEGLIRARDHGVDPEFIQGMKVTGHDIGDMESLIRARDHGVDPDYVQGMRHHGLKLDMDELVRARDHGVDEDFVAGWIALGYKDLTLEELVRLRDHGVTAAWAKRQNSGRSRLSVDELVRRRDRGGEAF